MGFGAGGAGAVQVQQGGKGLGQQGAVAHGARMGLSNRLHASWLNQR